ncbi:threonine/serine exporter family protein [Clavibacter michiganensis]|nr:threonine/serine exporter family protein [Clavibacter michiganensis]
MRDVRARLRGTIYEGTEPAHGRLGDLYSPRQIVDFCLDLGEVMLASGADVRAVEIAIVAVSTKWNLAPLELDITGTAITIQYAPLEGPPLVKLRVVTAEGSDLHRLSLVYQIVDELLHDDRDMTSAVEGLVEVLRSPPRWPSWITDAAMGLFGVSVSLQAGGSLPGAVGAFLLMIGAMVLGRQLSRRGIPPFFVVAVQSAAVAALGTLAIWSGVMPAGSAAAMVAAVVVLILPHVTIVTWAQDAISGFRAMALSRAMIIVLIVAGIAVGIPGGLALTAVVDIEVDPTDITLRALPLWMLLITTFFAAGATGITQGANARVMPVAIGMALVGTVSLWILKAAGVPLLAATFLVATLLGALGTVVAARVRPVAHRIGDLVVDPGPRRASRAGEEIDLTSREFAVLEFLARNAGRVVSKREVVQDVRDDDFEGDPSIVEVYVAHLRRKLDRPYGTATIETVRGAGYRLGGSDA